MLAICASLLLLSTIAAQSRTSEDILEVINEFRGGIARGIFNNRISRTRTYLPQTSALFKLTDDPSLANYASILAMWCKPNVFLPPDHSYVIYSAPSYVDTYDLVNTALADWYKNAYDVLPADDVTYNRSTAKILDGFAQVVYHKTLRASCSLKHEQCQTKNGRKKNSFACVFDAAPRIGEPLYPVNKNVTLGHGCVSESCPKINDKEPICDAYLGLCSV
ncbi:unnamed protein product [Nippostrongylus brasiliensis]|uniref:SCP domain-containing protein n=1 Tax=Nippostrongylus brasiliensis TaxID=27835 RepID=A0A0N4YES3_NIPBR|nr:unnamed protein product [Nippostrongylus brasiliensis]